MIRIGIARAGYAMAGVVVCAAVDVVTAYRSHFPASIVPRKECYICR